MKDNEGNDKSWADLKTHNLNADPEHKGKKRSITEHY
jgi:hypothetical protein